MLGFFSVFLLFGALEAEEPKRLQPGDKLPNLTYTNQHDEPSPLPEDTTKVLFVADMEASKLVVPILELGGDNYLTSKKAAFISDIHRMPAIITKFVALPKMRSYPFTMRLIREEKLSDPFPREKGKVTLLQIDSQAVSQIEFAATEKEVKTFLEKEAIRSTNKKK